MDAIGFFKTFNPDYLFAPAGEYNMRKDVNEHQTALVESQAARGLLTPLQSQAKIAEISNTTLGTIRPEDRPSTVFVSEMTTDFNQKFSDSFGNIVASPFRLIPPIVWVLLIIGLLLYLEVTTGIVRRKLATV
jgi:hypothetical protein